MLAQRSFDDLGTPLAAVTFCVLDLETTGGAPGDSAITEIGALKVRRGEVVGAFQTLVDPGCRVPAFIRLLTGISDEMLVDAPPIESVLPSLLEFVGGSVIVAHNARFDLGFLNAALGSADYPALVNPVVDTAALARKILAGEVRNHKLATLARALRCPHQPCHRAYADVLATTDVLHCLIERVAGFGVTTLEDLLAISSTRIDGTFSKIALADDLPSGIGVYRFIGSGGRTLYVGRASDLRSRVRSYFYGDPRRQIKHLLREVEKIEVERFPTTLEAAVAEARAITRESPPYNRAGKRPSTWYLKASLKARVPRLGSARVPRDDGAIYVGPFSSARVVRTLIDALRDALPLHRCNDPAKCRGCAFAEMGTCPDGQGDLHRRQMQAVATALVFDPGVVLEGVERRMRRLAAQERFEEAAEVRERGALLERSLVSALEARALCSAGRLELAIGERVVLVNRGRLVAAGDAPEELRSVAGVDEGEVADPEGEIEARIIARWLRRNSAVVRVLYAQRGWALPTRARPTNRFGVRRAGSGGGDLDQPR